MSPVLLSGLMLQEKLEVESGSRGQPVDASNLLADAYVTSQTPNNNWGRFSELDVGGIEGDYYRIWLKFDLSAIPQGVNITGATLSLHCWGKLYSYDSPFNATVYSAPDTWTEYGITWNSAPAPTSSVSTAFLSGKIFVRYVWNVTDAVRSEYDGDKTLSLMIRCPEDGRYFSFRINAKESGKDIPKLEISYEGA